MAEPAARQNSPENGIAITAPVKINLALHVVGQRADGYHLLESLVVFSPDGDLLTFKKSQTDSFAIDGVFAGALDTGGDNLVIKARDALRAAAGAGAGQDCGPVAIRLTKRLPVASGLGGGSGDAAATLAGLAQLWRLRLAPEQLNRLALALGADVPMCLAGMQGRQALFAGGIGEKLEALGHFPPLHLVLVNPGVAISTPAVFAGLQNRCNAPLAVDRQRAYKLAEVVALLHDSRNDLYQPAQRLAPVLETVLGCLQRSGALFARMSGSGATCFGVYRTRAEAQQAAEVIASTHPAFFVIVTTTFGKTA